MMQWFRSFFKAPTFEDEQKNYQAYLLYNVLLGLVALPIPYVLYTLAASPENLKRALFQSISGEVITFLLIYLLQRRYVKLASILNVAMFWLFFTISATTGVGVQGESYLLGYPLVIMFAGLLLSSRAALLFTVLSLLAGYLMTVGAVTGVISSSNSARTPMLTWSISIAFFIMGVLIQHLSAKTIRKALMREKEKEERYRLISDVSTDYVFESKVNEQGLAETVWISGAFEKMTGYTPEEYFAAGGWYAHIHKDDIEQDTEDMERLLKKQSVLGSEIRTFTKDGKLRWERIFAHPIWDEKQNRLVGILGAVQDITERKEAERKLQEILSQQEAILNNIPDMAWLKDLESRYIAVNEQFLQISGLSKKDVIGKTDADIWEKPFADIYHQDDLGVIKSGKRKTVEEIQRDGKGNEYWVETTKTPIFNEHGTVIGTAGIARDISERKHAEMEREQLITELAAKNAELERFTYTVSHDLKSPLVTITGFLGYLERAAQTGKMENFERDINRIRQAAEKMQTLLNDLLNLSRIGRIANEPTEEDFGSIVRDALANLNGPITAGNVKVEFMEEGHKVYGDRVRLVEVLQNLIENAVKFMGDQPHPTVTIGSTKDEEDTIVFFVKDNGIGIEQPYQERIFGLFNKLDTSTEGTGIGLTLVKRIIEVHHGSIWLQSEPGQGSTFYFTLPTTKN